MKKSFLFLTSFLIIILFLNFRQSNTYKDGDIIFQTTSGPTGKAIQLATHSQYNHCGLLFFENNEWVVYEAVQPVRKTSLTEFNARGKGTIKRLANISLSNADVTKLKALFKSTFENKNYDEAFNWSDDQIYCSELVFKLYHKALNIELCKPRKLSDFDLSHPLVKEKLNEKYNHNIPLNEPMVSPEDIFSSTLLSSVK
ncbi:MAG: peptidoglycan peptidase [Burkholderiales bacterium]|nr:peptidoglycan peptidase [Bacteroidia bacterium]